MLSTLLQQILILQDRDKHRRDLEHQLAAVPKDIAHVENRIASEKAAIESAKTELKELEAKKKVVDTEIASAEIKIGRYRTQQLEVRKNDEYRALGHEIETVLGEIGKMEEQEIALLYGIDEARKRFQAAEALLKSNISGHESRLKTLRERDLNLKKELQEALKEFEASRKPLDENSLRLYERIAQRHFPACVPIRGTKCGGCHLKVSSEVESATRAKDPKLVTCDQCGRLVWWDI